MLYIIVYDISNDDRRRKVSDALENFGTRVQESVFECHLTPQQQSEVQECVERIIKVEDDSVRYYRVCRDCVEQSRVVGPTPLTTDPDYYMV